MTKLNGKAHQRATAMIQAHEKEMKDLTPDERLVNMLTDIKVYAYDEGLDWEVANDTSTVLALSEARQDG